MSVKVTVPNTSSDSVVFGSANTPTAAEVVGIDSGSSNGQLAFKTTASGTSTERMRIDANGNVGIGTSSPSRKLQVISLGTEAIVASSASADWTEIATWSGTSNEVKGQFQSIAGATLKVIFGSRSNHPVAFNTNDTERMRIDSSGNVGIGTSSPTSKLTVNGTANIVSTGSFGGQLSVVNSGSDFSGGINLNAAGSGYIVGTGSDGTSSTVANVKIASWDGVGFAASISGQTVPYGQNAVWLSCRSGAMYTRSTLTQNASDKRLKENFEVIPNALEKIDQIHGYTFDWKTDKCFDLGFQPTEPHEHGVIAQEIKAVIPDAVTFAPFDTEHDEDGKAYSRSGEEYLTVRYEKLIPLLLQGVKEQQELIKQLQADVALLKGTA